METSKNISEKDNRWWENTILHHQSPDHVYFDEVSSRMKKQQKEKTQLLQNLNILFKHFDLFNDMTEEERQALYGVFKEQKSMRKISRELGRDNHTIRRRYDTAIRKIKKHLGIYLEMNN